MRIGELSRRTGVSVPTIKFYVREGLLPAGELTSPNQASYGEAHVQRLRLIRALLDVGGLPVAGVREVMGAIDDPDRSLHEVLGEAAEHVVPRYERGGGAGVEQAREKVDALIAGRGWRTYEGNPAAEALAMAFAALEEAGHGGFLEVVEAYADAAEQVARVDLDYVARRVAREELVESVVVGTVIGDAIFAAMRRLAHVHASDQVFGRVAEWPDETVV